MRDGLIFRINIARRVMENRFAMVSVRSGKNEIETLEQFAPWHSPASEANIPPLRHLVLILLLPQPVSGFAMNWEGHDD